ncbi:DUF3429 domain-containing protein [Phenylobacterium sp.]|jgi:ABC-type Fe3+-siderophore transport system permease subunit|uniref:DUF3429 domain-containing protein n=1 Tax=Phenylobacterium sp. TaxID=1871053 RepID=UPI002E352FBE|nr:DUF3429 domain-containing protein [Phenylobacterium sp.]HEX2559433.1 DUF3429 domain-containing protein [Phenylobacterium sp.]
MEAETSAPLPLWIIAVAALSPFPVSAVVYAYGPGHLADDALTVILTWSAIVMSFVGGVRWGLETSRESPRSQRLAASIVGPVFAWVLILARGRWPETWLLCGFLSAFLLQWLFDHTAPDVPTRWPRLLTVLTLGAGLSLAIALEQALRL